MTHYEVTLTTADLPVPVDAEKFYIEKDYVTFFSRPAPGEKFEEVQSFKTEFVKDIKET